MSVNVGCVAHGAHDVRVESIPGAGPGPGEVLVNVAYGGICGSDLHYYHRGAVGDFRLQEPMILGHEGSGVVAATGSDVTGLLPGTPVVLHPATPCNSCPECRRGRRNICRNTRYLGSAASFPHTQGCFATAIRLPADQIIPIPPSLDLALAALAEPLSVAMHAVSRAGSIAGKRVLVTGAGPIGCLVVAVLAHAGAAEIVVSDLLDPALELARTVGATRTFRPGEDPGEAVDAAIEASGSAPGAKTCVEQVTRGGRVVLLGLQPPGDMAFPGNLVVTREIEVVGAFRFDAEMHDAVKLLADGLPVRPLITAMFPLADAVAALDHAGDRTHAGKIMLDLRGGQGTP